MKKTMGKFRTWTEENKVAVVEMIMYVDAIILIIMLGYILITGDREPLMSLSALSVMTMGLLAITQHEKRISKEKE